MKILAILEHQNGRLHRMAWETLAAAQHITGEAGTEEAAVIGSGIAALAQEVAGKKLARVYSVDWLAP